MAASKEPAGRLSSAAWDQVHAHVARFEEAWGRGERPDIAGLLAAAGPDGGPALLVELVHTDLEYRLKAGENGRAEDYLRRFPALAADAEAVVQLAAAEYELRRRREPALAPEEFLRRFPEHASRLAPLLARPAAASPPPTTIPDASAQADSLGSPGRPDLEDYEILGELGRGGMGVVYRALDRRRRSDVALKTLPRLEASALYRFKQEFRSLAGVAHPNLVTLYELIAEGSVWFFTMEYVDGVDFLRHVREGAPERSGADPARLRDALRQLAAGLTALHAAGKLHRDVKPSNVLVDRAGRVVLLDFGLAAELDPAGQHQSLASGLVGTVAYMAPEQAAGMPVSPASDWYSVGVMLYQALTGRLPFEGGPLQVLHDKRVSDPPRARDLAPDAPEDLDALCADLLRREPDRRPPGPDVLRRLGGATAGASPPAPEAPAPRTVFVGREEELRTLSEAFRAATEGRTVAVWVRGQSGVGKSALAQRFLDGLAGRADAVVLSGRCYEQESVPYKALDSLIDALSRCLGRLPPPEAQAVLPRDIHHLARVFPVLRRVEAVARAPARAADPPDPHEARRRASAALRELLARLGDRRAVVLYIDDLQWGDLDSATLLADLLRPPDPPALLLLGTYRSEEAASSPFLQSLGDVRKQCAPSCLWQEVAVDALSPDEARRLAVQLLGQLPAAEEVARESGGNPFFVHELARAASSGVGPGPAEGSVSLDRVLWQRIERLPAGAKGLLEVVATAGRPLRQTDAARAAGLGAEMLPALTLLRGQRFVRNVGSAGEGVVIAYHDRVRETVVAHLPPDASRDVHRRLAAVLEESGQADPELLAVHYQGAGEPERAGRHYAAAADNAARILAFDQAARLYRLSLQLNPPAGAEECRLRTKLGDALTSAGRGAEAAAEYLRAAAGMEGNASLELRRRAAMQLLVSGRQDEGRDVLRTVLAAVGLKLPASSGQAIFTLLFRRFQLWLRGLQFKERSADQVPEKDLIRIDTCWSAAVGLSMTDNVVGSGFQAQHLLLSLAAGEPSRVALSLGLEIGLSGLPGARTRPRTAAITRQATALAERVGSHQALGLIALWGGAARAWCEGAWQETHREGERADAIFRQHCTGVAWERATAQVFSLAALGWMGEWKRHGERLPALLREAAERGDQYGLTTLPLLTYSYVLDLAADEPARARERIREAMKHWSPRGVDLQQLWALYGEWETDLYCGDPARAWAAISHHQAAVKASFLLRVQTIRLFVLHVRARSAVATAAAMPSQGRPSPAVRRLWRAAEADAGRMAREDAAWAQPLAQTIRAALAFQCGDPSFGRLLAEAEAGYTAAEMGLFAAAVRRRRGRLLGGAEGQALVERADAWMAAQGVRNPDRMTAVYAPGFPS